MRGPTPRETLAWEAVQRHGGLETPGAWSAARRELGWSSGAMGSAVSNYRLKLDANDGQVTPRRRLSRAEVVSLLPERLEEVERHLASLLESQAALSVQIFELGDEIRAWTTRQPIYVEMRPRHQRVADGGEGGQRERKRLRAPREGAA